MRVDLGTGIPAPPVPEERVAVATSSAPGFDRFELGILIAFAATSLWVLGLDLWQVVAHGRVWTGTDGVYIVDQMQYLSWIRSASHHLFVSNMFVLRSTPADYFQPAVVVSAGLAALGVAPWLSLLIWKPVAVVMLFFGVRAFVHRTLEGIWARRIAILLTLFFGSFTVLYGDFGVIGDLFPGFLTWGYEFGLIALALMVWGLIAYDRARTQGTIAWAPGLLGALASLLHPWHGELMIVVLIGAELFIWTGIRPTRRQLELTVLTVVLTGLPLIYYMLLGRLDLSWKLARVASKHAFPLIAIVIVIVPLMIPALFAYRRRPPGFLPAVARSWPIASFFVYIVSATGLSATPLHAFQGITLPLAVLAVQGAKRWRMPRLHVRHRTVLVALAVFVFTVPTTVYEFGQARDLASPTVNNANFILRDERSALDYLADLKTPGGVFTRSYLGATVPERTSRRTLIGDCLWSEPNCYARERLAQAFFDGTLSAPAARTLVRQSGALFVLADCSSKANIPRTLGEMVDSVHHFGCAALYTLHSASPATGPLAESRGDADLRAARRQHRRG